VAVFSDSEWLWLRCDTLLLAWNAVGLAVAILYGSEPRCGIFFWLGVALAGLWQCFCGSEWLRLGRGSAFLTRSGSGLAAAVVL
jgi:hypothetical protein